MARHKHWKKTDELSWVNDNGARLEVTGFNDEMKWWDVSVWNAKGGDFQSSEAFGTKADALFVAREFLKNNDNPDVTLTDLQIRFRDNMDELMELGTWEEAFFVERFEETISLRFKKVERITLKTIQRIQEIFDAKSNQVTVANNDLHELCIGVTKSLSV